MLSSRALGCLPVLIWPIAYLAQLFNMVRQVKVGKKRMEKRAVIGRTAKVGKNVSGLPTGLFTRKSIDTRH